MSFIFLCGCFDESDNAGMTRFQATRAQMCRVGLFCSRFTHETFANKPVANLIQMVSSHLNGS